MSNQFSSKLIVLIMLVWCSFSQAQSMVFSPKVIDGDTIVTNVQPFENLSPIKLRLDGIDTPEMKGKCALERQRAVAAKDFVVQVTRGKNVKIMATAHDKYGGRVVGKAFVDGQSISDMMIINGHAVKYYGGKKTKDWCK